MMIMPEVVVQKILAQGLKELRFNKPAFYDVFAQFAQDELSEDYGISYIDEVWKWFSTTKIPIIRAWSLNTQQIPCISVHLANETEDESKAAVGDYFGAGLDNEVGTGVFTVMVDIGLHTSRAGDQVLWLYYITNYILFKHKLTAERLGLKLQTFSASDYNKDASKMTDNIWTRWVRFRCTTENFWAAEPYYTIEDVNVDAAIGLEQARDLATGLDVDPCEVDITKNQGILAESGTNPGDEPVDI
jgi:hypothetical protein